MVSDRSIQFNENLSTLSNVLRILVISFWTQSGTVSDKVKKFTRVSHILP